MQQNPNEITYQIIGAAIDVHRELGPGHDEILYEDALEVALRLRAIQTDRQPPLPLYYKAVKLDCGFRPDFVVEKTIVAECKAVELEHPIFGAQLRTYQRLGGWAVGLLLNFNVPMMKDGVSRFIVDPLEFRNQSPLTADFPTAVRRLDIMEGIIAAAIEVHRCLGPGLLNSAYQAALLHELSLAGINFECRCPVRAIFQGVELQHSAELDLVVEQAVLVTAVSVQEVQPIHEAKTRSQMRLGNIPAGLLLNFHAQRLLDDVRQFGHQPPFASFKTPSASG